MPPHTTKRRTTTIYKEKTTRTDRKSNCMEVGQPELTEKHSSRPVGGAETGSWAERTRGKAAAGGPGWARQQLVEQAVPQSSVDNREEQLGSQTGHATQGSSMGK